MANSRADEFSFDTPDGPSATGYVLTVDGPKPSSRYISAGSVDAALLLAKASTWTEYGDETDPEVLASRVVLKAGESVTFEGTARRCSSGSRRTSRLHQPIG